MSERKPRLDWIKKVLVDFEAHDSADAAVRMIAMAATVVPFDRRARSDHREAKGEGLTRRGG